MTFEINTPNGPAVQSKYGPVLLADLFDADTERGVLIWKQRPIELFDSQNYFTIWNARFAGALAFASGRGGVYRCGGIFGRSTAAHRVLFAMHNGNWPSGHVDHVNRIKTDNRADNLRDVSRTGNNRNMGVRADNTSGVVGVSWHKRAGKWHAQIGVGGKSISLGLFADLADAAISRKTAETKYGFHENHGRRRID